MKGLKRNQAGDMESSVLVVDDAGIIRVACERALKRAGYMVETADSGEAALKMMQGNPADVVLLDIRMPGISGVEVLREVKVNWPLTEVVIMTAYADQDIAEESINLGASEILLKPFENIRNMTEAVTKAMTRVRIQKGGPRFDDRTIQQLLLDQGVCGMSDIKKALAHAEKNASSLRQSLVALGLITDEDIDWAAARYLEIPYVRIQKKLMDSELVSDFPAELAQRYTCLPLWKEDEYLHLVMANPFDASGIREIEERIQQKVKPAKGDESEIKSQIRKFYTRGSQVVPLQDLIGLLREAGNHGREKIIESILAQTCILELREAEIIPKDNDLYEFHITGIMSARKRNEE